MPDRPLTEVATDDRELSRHAERVPDTEARSPAGAASGGLPQPTSSRVLLTVERYALLWLTVAIALFFALNSQTSDTFLSTGNIRNVVGNESVTAILAMSAIVPLVALQFDISIGAILGAASIIVAKLSGESGWPLGIAIVAALAFAVVVGLSNGILVSYVGASSFITTLGMATLLGGLVALYTDNQSIVDVPQSLVNFGNGNWLGVPKPTFVVVAVAGMVGYFLRYTLTGRQLLYIGSNPSSARLVGVPVERRMLQAFVIGAFIAGIAGVVLLARTGAGNPDISLSATLNAITAVFLGTTTIRPGQFNVRGTFVGVFFVAISVNGLTLLGADNWVNSVFNGVSVIVAVTTATLLAKRRGVRASVL
jgi:ribose transport system permease protein